MKKAAIKDTRKIWESKFGMFHELMKHRIVNILLVSSSYDLFIIEGDGQLSDLIIEEYLDLNLRYLPRITRVSTVEQAAGLLKQQRFDMVIVMLGTGAIDHLAFGRQVKDLHPGLPVVLLAYDATKLETLIKEEMSQVIDKVFLWQGDVKLLLAIIKVVEDQLNAPWDVEMGGVLVIILIEDSVRFYSSYLPHIYREIVRQTQNLMADSTNATERLLRMRARPKIITAQTFEEAREVYERFRGNLLGVITDAEFPAGGRMDNEAGLKFIRLVKDEQPDIPILLQSSTPQFAVIARELRVKFLNKVSPTLLEDLRDFLQVNLGFGDFVFRTSDNHEVGRAADLRSLREWLHILPLESIRYHSERNHFSHWLKARTEFDLANKLRPLTISDFDDLEHVRQYLIQALEEFQIEKQKGEVTLFASSRLDTRAAFARIGRGSIGGKARGLAFFNSLINRRKLNDLFPGVQILVPPTVVVCTDVFDEFMESNSLREQAAGDLTEEALVRLFLQASFPAAFQNDLETFLSFFEFPLAIRSSSLLEDSKYLPFAGIYSTVLLPNNHRSVEVRLRHLQDAIKVVYASMFFPNSKKYLKSSPYRVEEEKMAVMMQQLIGTRHDDRFYPVISGVARSLNHYPVPPMSARDGMASVALGLGKTVVEGGQVLRFCPACPQALPQFSTTDDVLTFSQKEFYSLDMRADEHYQVSARDMNLLKEPITRAHHDGILQYLGSTYSAANDRLYEGVYRDGVQLVTFAPILKSRLFPLADILALLLELGREGMACEVEIEFAVEIHAELERPDEFGFLQIRPAITGLERGDVSLTGIRDEDVVCSSSMSLGNGRIDTLRDIVYVRPERFDRARTVAIAAELGSFNDVLRAGDTRYVLIGFCRWGTSDPWLGIPVMWSQIANSSVIVESGLEDFYVEPSQGTHFFQNLISHGVAYMTVNPGKDGAIDWNWLASLPAKAEGEFVRHVRLERPLDVRIDGRLGRGVILKPHDGMESTGEGVVPNLLDSHRQRE
ncbi:histidine kinase [bacterium]|nr:histidine kinase [candidate division CSSED10-310 bacterium]